MPIELPGPVLTSVLTCCLSGVVNPCPPVSVPVKTEVQASDRGTITKPLIIAEIVTLSHPVTVRGRGGGNQTLVASL